MKIAVISYALFLFFTFQKKTDINFIGTWKVSEVMMDQSSPMAKNPSMMSMLRTVMLKTNYTFLPDHHFKVTGIPNNGQAPDGIWSYDARTGKLDVRDAANPKARVINIQVVKDAKGQVFFKMSDAPVTLKVYKQ